VAYAIVALFGKTTLGLAYSLVFAEALLAPAIPSVAARAGGIFFPLVKALCLACGSDPVRAHLPFFLQEHLPSHATCAHATCRSEATPPGKDSSLHGNMFT
jgi:di/tricarboxylate transporter